MLRVTRDLMLPTAITGSYPRPLWYDANLSGRSFKAALGDSMFREQYLDAVAAVINAHEAAGRSGSADHRPCSQKVLRTLMVTRPPSLEA